MSAAAERAVAAREPDAADGLLDRLEALLESWSSTAPGDQVAACAAALRHALEDHLPPAASRGREGRLAAALARLAADGQWLTCTDDGRLDIRSELLARNAYARNALAGNVPAEPQPAPGGSRERDLPQSAYLYHCKFGGLGGDEYGLFWRKEDADAAAANRAGEGYTEVLGIAILGGQPEQPAPGDMLFEAFELIANAAPFEPNSAEQWERRKREWVTAWHAYRDEQAQPAEVPARPTTDGRMAILLADDIRHEQPAPELAAAIQDIIDRYPEREPAPELAGSVVRVISTAPELREAMAETRHLRADLRTLADLWDASSNRDEEIAARPNRARLVLEERATTRRNCAADIRKLAGPEGK